MTRYKITLFKLNSKGKEQIIKCEIFNNRVDAMEFIENNKAEPKPYKMKKCCINYQMSAL